MLTLLDLIFLANTKLPNKYIACAAFQLEKRVLLSISIYYIELSSFRWHVIVVRL